MTRNIMSDPQEDVPACSTGTNTNSLTNLSPYILPGESNQYPMNMAVDFTRLQLNALRKYMTLYDIPEAPGSSREQVAITVARHFNVECKKADETSSITSFMTFLTGSSNTVAAAEIFQSRSISRFNCKKKDDEDDKENQSRQRTSHTSDVEAELAERVANDLYDRNQVDEAELNGVVRPFVVKERRAVNRNNIKCRARGQERTDDSDAGVIQTKKRKGRLYCICKGGSFGNMIACDNKKCLDRSNWYHMSCVGLNALDEPPETWYCPPCQENDSADIPENQYRKPVASVTYGDMISHALTLLPDGKGSFKNICDFIEIEYESQLNWKLESDQRKSPVWKSSVRKILFSNVRFQKHPDGNGMFCLAA